MRAALLLLSMGAACATSVAAVDAPPLRGPTHGDLPEDADALLALADDTAKDGPEGPELERSLSAMEKLLAAEPTHGGALWRAARAIYYQTRAAPEHDAELSARCMQYGALAEKHSEDAEAPFYSALCMGARAQAVNSEGLDLVKKMVAAGEAAKAKDAKVVHGGPDRLLGGIYLRAPSWPTSIGDPEQAIEHLEAAARLDPRWPENHVLLAEAYLAEDRDEDARRALDAAKAELANPDAKGWRKELERSIAKLEAELAER